MYLKSKIPLTYNNGMTGQKSSSIIGVVNNFSRNGDCTMLAAAYSYHEDAEGNPEVFKGVFELVNAEQIEELYNIIKNDLPSTDDEPLYERTKIYLAMRLEMVAAFLPLNPELTIEDIEIIA